MEIRIRNEQTKTALDLTALQAKAERILDGLGYPEAELSLLLVDDQEITRLNTLYLNRPRSTNVISFPQNEGEDSNLNPEILGDVVISVDTALREAEAAGKGLDQALDRLMVHGILHLLGYDHETPEADTDGMERKEVEVMGWLGWGE